MEERTTLYDRVRAAYDLGENDDDAGGSKITDLPVSSSSTPPQLLDHLRELKVNSIRVQFDPDDQSDDEVVITSIYKRDNKSAKANGPGNGSTDLAGPKKTLSPEAPAFQPATIPLVDLYSSKGTGSVDARSGDKYPGNRVPFCPWLIARNYHSWFVGKQNGARIGPYFEKEAILKVQAWDFCYVWHPGKGKESKYILLVPTSQFRHFLDRINQTLKIQLTIPPGANGDKFAVVFGQMKTPVPRFLGRAPNLLAFEALTRAVPPLDPADAIFEMPNVKPQAKEMFVRKVEALSYQYGKGPDKKNKSEQVQIKRLRERREWGRQIKRVQRYMGIRGKIDTFSLQSNSARYVMQSLNYLFVPPFAQENDVVFVAMDIESFEFDHSAITEIGFAILDTRNFTGVPPGLGCANWLALIQGRHLRIAEHMSMVNRVHVKGCENSFNFGRSEFISIKDILPVVTRILQPQLRDGSRRNVVLVGHDIKSDISLIKNIGFHMTDGIFLEVVDTQYFHQHLRMKNQQTGLKGVLADLDIDNYFLHNGGNDAVYTLQAMVRIVVEKREASLRRHAERLRPGFIPDASILEEGWDSGGEMTDGSPYLNWPTGGYASSNSGTPFAFPSTTDKAFPQKTRKSGSPAGKTVGKPAWKSPGKLLGKSASKAESNTESNAAGTSDTTNEQEDLITL
ncbi:QDE-2-interacting protein [Sporothrix schenckii 1099-18]|uniref:QDE-2-interacting protein n=1 Tax=Sporothrix schenckii 1099-18 TaxID=1397361 RepID=A0A0F2MDZ2_SPOSC|nr:QDE-2-interacting protein [Sporothrix schenckii 1099-18]KJR87862.1 QDE-2-interacting protein [Sporothrix schenckii 1099-18]